MKVLILFIAIFTLPSNGQQYDDEINHLNRTPSQIVMDSVASDDRSNFVAYHIWLALNERNRNDVVFKPVLETIPLEKREEFASTPTPPNFSTNLLDWTELELVPLKNPKTDSLGLFKANYRGNEVQNVCFPNGCVDPNDAGSLCCPF